MKHFKRYLQVAPVSHALWRSLEAKSVDKIEIKRPVLDLGCGFGEFAGVFFNRMIEAGIDVAENDLIEAAKKKKYKKLIWADARNLPFEENTFNTILSISVLEHINDVEKVFFEAFRILKPKGNFIFTVPTHIYNDLLFFPPPKSFWLKIYHWSFNHQVVVSRDEWLKMAERAGFGINKCQGLISKRQVRIYESFLPLALPTQIFRLIFKKRLPVSPKLRIELLCRIFKRILSDKKVTEANILVVAQKPLDLSIKK